MSLGISRVRSFPPGALEPAGKASPRRRRGQSAGRRSGDQKELWIDAKALLIDEVTTREAADTILAQRDRMIAIFGHDLRGLLNALTVNADVFLRHEEATSVESAKNVRLAIGRMDQLTTSLLDYVRLKANKLEIVPRPLDVTALLREAVEIFRPLAKAQSLSLTLEIPDAPLWANADHDRLFQVISNLLSNAIKFNSVRGNIIVSATTQGHELLVAVRDEGPGIPERDLDRVFECFCQLQKSDARGLGLGLYISKAIIEAHGGRIGVTSLPGTGSTFCFTVPASPSPATA
ncbi:MAG: HAMP domain-containing sensor histidine kinase [Acidobacteriota bacterium]